MKLFFISLFCIAMLSAQNSYTLSDLQHLQRKQQWQELLVHLQDIPSSQRQSAWEDMVTFAMNERLSQLLLEDDAKKIWSFLQNYLNLYPQMREDAIFMQKRADFGLDYYTSCLGYNEPQCNKAFLAFVTDTHDKKFAFKVAKIVRLKASDRQALAYFDLARPINLAGSCKDDDLVTAVFEGLTLNSQHNELALAQRLAFGSCHDILKPVIKKAVLHSQTGLENNCRLAIDHNSLNGMTLNKCKRFLQQ